MMVLFRWLIGPIGKWVLIAAAFATWTMANRIDAARKARAEVNVSVLQARIEEEQNRAEEAERLRKLAQDRADATAAELADLETRKDALVDDVSGLSCDLPDDLRERLRGLQ